MTANNRFACYFATKLLSKRIVRVSGPDSSTFLQTLLTNDLRYLYGHRNVAVPCLYSFITNTMGRSIADVFVYNPKQPGADHDSRKFMALAPFHTDKFQQIGHATDELLIEVHSSLAKSLVNTLLAIKIKKQFTAEISKEMDLWALYPKTPQDLLNTFVQEVQSDDIIISRDPRLPFLGHRVLTRMGAKTLDELRRFLPTELELQKAPEDNYTQFRYQLGVGESEKDFPSRFVLPLECNADMLNAISFRKGLFTGNDIAARNHRKGMKKRLFPVEFKLSNEKDTINLADRNVLPYTQLLLENGETVGHIQQTNGRFGLAMITLKTFLIEGSHRIKLIHPQSGLNLEATVPFWWHHEKVKIPDGRPRTVRLDANQTHSIESNQKRRQLLTA